METAHSSSALTMNSVVVFFCCLLDHMISNPVVRIVMVARLKTLSAFKHAYGVSSAYSHWTVVGTSRLHSPLLDN